MLIDSGGLCSFLLTVVSLWLLETQLQIYFELQRLNRIIHPHISHKIVRISWEKLRSWDLTMICVFKFGSCFLPADLEGATHSECHLTVIYQSTTVFVLMVTLMAIHCCTIQNFLITLPKTEQFVLCKMLTTCVPCCGVRHLLRRH